jgi:hypothetical protein
MSLRGAGKPVIADAKDEMAAIGVHGECLLSSSAAPSKPCSSCWWWR